MHIPIPYQGTVGYYYCWNSIIHQNESRVKHVAFLLYDALQTAERGIAMASRLSVRCCV